MEGVMDHIMRSLLSSIGGMDYLVSEFIRVSQNPIPVTGFRRLVPEIDKNSHTEHGHPVHIQLLGSNAERIAQSAINAVAAGAKHIDMNFGCPAKRVNGHGGGSVLLQTPEQLHLIMSSLQQVLPSHIGLSAKIRLGYEDESLLFENVSAIEEAGTHALTVHGRTKKDGYKPPARWEKIGEINARSKMRIIANGDIDDFETLMRCHEMTGCVDFMIGRGSLSNPFVFRQLKHRLESEGHTVKTEQNKKEPLLTLIDQYQKNLRGECDEFATVGRLKQWCAYLKRHYPYIEANLRELRQTTTAEEFLALLDKIERS
ncbi:tRNA dihydrouridine synthase [Marinomonas mediterranea]|uniref:tRNA dihydrouridine synthase n=1 Tax=Marinomonas mediterranea TaxID=119864 RepID=UPI00234BE82F|nr:tRNA-dihydrouridine synthase family protein [Marinomonas mediterranea]